MPLEHAETSLLDIAYEEGGAIGKPVILLLHGWPDDIRAWRSVASRLQASGYRTIAPYLRGFGPTRFLSEDTFRDGRGVALAQDAIELADALGVERFAVVGHDWGARVAYSLAALFPDRVRAVAGISLGYQPRGIFKLPPFGQARKSWYQWFLTLDGGPKAFETDPKGFARLMWETWGPPGWFEESEFAATAESFDNPDWVAITLHAYRTRWRDEAVDRRYDEAQRRLEGTERLSTPTLMIQGDSDFCQEPSTSAGLEHHFSGPYQRLVLEGVGHSPHREAPDAVSAVINNLCEGV